MNKITRSKNANYTTISNGFLRDKRLSLKAKGLLTCVMTLPNDWDFSVSGMSAILKEGKDAIYSAIEELKECGYCEVCVCRDESGKIVGNDYLFIEEPHRDFPYVDNPPQINKEENKENIEKKKKVSKEKDTLFEECWLAYRRKGAKGKAYDVWKKLDDDSKDKVKSHIPFYVSTRELVYQRDFERYLRDRSFENIVVAKSGAVLFDPNIESPKRLGKEKESIEDGARNERGEIWSAQLNRWLK